MTIKGYLWAQLNLAKLGKNYLTEKIKVKRRWKNA